MGELNIHGRRVEHEDEHAKDYLLHKIDREEAEVLFKHAKTHGAAQFETQTGKNYTLVRKDNGTYTIMKR